MLHFPLFARRSKRSITASILTVFTLFLTNKFWLVNSSFKNFEIEVFIIILVLSFLLFYKLADYIADFKTLQGKSRLDIFFLIIFFCLLFIPVLHIDNRDKSIEENRMLAVYKPLFRNGKINYNYGKYFEKWFNDRFNFRIYLVKLYNTAKIFISDKNNKGFYDKNGFLYYYEEFERFDNNTINENLESLNRFNKFCIKNKIHLYVLVVPERTMIYNSSNKNLRINKTEEQLFINKVQRQNKTKIIYPYKELKESSDDNYLFFKTDHHWTDDGAFIGYKALMNEMKKDFPNIKDIKTDDYNFFYKKQIRKDFSRKFDEYGQANRILGINNFFCKRISNAEYKYYIHKDFNNLEVNIINTDYELTKNYFYPQGYPLKVVLLGTSQSENLCEFIPFTFRNVLRLRTNNTKNKEVMKYYKEKILNYKPDIVVFCISYRQLKYIKSMFTDY